MLQTVNFKKVLRWDAYDNLFRLFRVTWKEGKVGSGKGYSCKFSVALQPKLYALKQEDCEIKITLLGVRFHFAKSYGGEFV